VLEAAYHAICGEEAEEAILLLAEQQYLLIEQGHAPAMQSLLSGIASDQMSKPVRQLLRELRIELSKLLGDYDQAEREARAAAQEAISATTQARAEQLRGELAKQRGHVGLAADHYQHALRLLATKEATLEVWLHRDLAWVLAEQNNIDEAWDEAQRARIALENTLGIIARRRGELDLALQHLEQGARIAEEYGEQRTLTRLRNNMALIYLAKKQYQTAIALYQQNLTLINEIGELVGQAITLMNLGDCYGEVGASEKAIHHLKQALPIFETLGDSKGLLLVHINLAEQQLQLKELDSALKHAQIAISYNKSLVPTTAHAYALRIYAEILLAQDKKKSRFNSSPQKPTKPYAPAKTLTNLAIPTTLNSSAKP
jgi:tetratricopeptide (TPR) repeat protein